MNDVKMGLTPLDARQERDVAGSVLPGSGAVEALAEMADRAAENAREMYRLTGEHDPLLTNVRIQTGGGAWRSLGAMRLSDIGHLRVVQYDFDAIPGRYR